MVGDQSECIFPEAEGLCRPQDQQRTRSGKRPLSSECGLLPSEKSHHRLHSSGKVAEKMHMTKFRYFLLLRENLATLTALKSRYIDPEQASSSLSWKNGRGAGMVYPYARTFTFGLDITL